MYSFFWRVLPGGLIGKLAGSLVMLVAVLALLFFVVFPWASPKLPFNEVTVDSPNPSPTATATANPGTPS